MTRDPLRPSYADYGPVIEARHPVTSAVLATGTRSNGNRDEWVGWWVRTLSGDTSEVVMTKLLAKHMVLEFGTAILAGTVPGCVGGVPHCATWREGTGPCAVCGKASWYTALAVAVAA